MHTYVCLLRANPRRRLRFDAVLALNQRRAEGRSYAVCDVSRGSAGAWRSTFLASSCLQKQEWFECEMEDMAARFEGKMPEDAKAKDVACLREEVARVALLRFLGALDQACSFFLIIAGWLKWFVSLRWLDHDRQVKSGTNSISRPRETSVASSPQKSVRQIGLTQDEAIQDM